MRRLVVLGVLVYWLVQPVPAASEGFGLLQLFVEAQTADPGIRAARSEFEAIKQSVPEAFGLYLPTLAVTAALTETAQTINSSDNEVFGQGTARFPTTALTLTLSQPIVRYEYLVQYRQAKASVREAGIRALVAEQDLVLRSATAYLDVLAARDNLEFALAEQHAYEQQLTQIERRKDVGFANATEVFESRARYEFTRSTVADALNDLDDARAGLAELLGRAPDDELLAITGVLPLIAPDPAAPEDWVERAMSGNLQLQARRHAVDAADLEIRRQRSAAYPTLDLVVNGEQRVTEGSLFGGGSDVEDTSVRVQLRVPIFQGGQVRARSRIAQHRFQQNLDIAEQERRAVQRLTRAAYRGVVSGITKVEALALSLQSQELTLQSKLRGYRTGVNTNLEVLDAQRDLFLVRRDYSRARYDYLLSLLNLKYQVGSLSVDDLGEIEDMLGVSPDSASRDGLADTALAPRVRPQPVPLRDRSIDAEIAQVRESMARFNPNRSGGAQVTDRTPATSDPAPDRIEPVPVVREAPMPQTDPVEPATAKPAQSEQREGQGLPDTLRLQVRQHAAGLVRHEARWQDAAAFQSLPSRLVASAPASGSGDGRSGLLPRVEVEVFGDNQPVVWLNAP